MKWMVFLYTVAVATARVSFELWSVKTKHQIRLRISTTHQFTRWSRKALAVPFETWRSQIQEHRRLRNLNTKVGKSWRMLAVWAPFRTYLERYGLQTWSGAADEVQRQKSPTTPPRQATYGDLVRRDTTALRTEPGTPLVQDRHSLFRPMCRCLSGMRPL